MPARKKIDVLVVDPSHLARNMYQLLFASQPRYQVRFGDEFESYFKKSVRMRPDLLVVNAASLGDDTPSRFPCPAIVIVSGAQPELKEGLAGKKEVVLIEKPFYPFDLLSVANRLTQRGEKAPRVAARRSA